jgi:hypothetical protein
MYLEATDDDDRVAQLARVEVEANGVVARLVALETVVVPKRRGGRGVEEEGRKSTLCQ